MVRTAPLVAAVCAAFASLFAAPAAGQSLTLVAVPIVYRAGPVVQQSHEGRRIAPLPVAPGDEVTVSLPSRPLAAMPAAYQVRVTRPGLAAEAPRWQAPAFVDRSARNYRRGLGDYGPFRVIDDRRVALIGETDARTPRWFSAMLADHPGLAQLDMVECPGTQDDRANMQLGRMIRGAGLSTYVPAAGSVRSGAVELFLAGAARYIADGAEFAVHSWRDAQGREAADFAMEAPQNRQYLEYYRDMGMSAAQARAFYDFTNSVPHTEALWLRASEMRRWTPRGNAVAAASARSSAVPAG